MVDFSSGKASTDYTNEKTNHIGWKGEPAGYFF